jgi:hypothetical protein
MIPIFEEGRDGPIGYTFPDFRRRFLDICAEHLRLGRALLFAFLLFDVDTPEIAKVLRDPDYWRALDKISGHYLTVFTLLTHEPRPQPRHRGMEFLVGAGPASDPGAKLRLILSDYFGIEAPVALPAVILFQVAQEKVSWFSLVKLHAASIESSFTEIRDLLRDLVDGLAKADPGSMNAVTSVEAIENRLLKRKALQFFKAGKKVVEGVKEIADITGMLT